MIGKILAHYKILDKVGEGGMGEVYIALDEKLGRKVALKVLPPELANDPERRKRFEREARAVAALNHPHIVTIHSVEEADGVHFITMELVEGEMLADRIPRGGVSLEDFFAITIPLTDAVSAAHVKGVAHRDLKPANIMFDAAGRLKVLDFGLAKLIESNVETDRTVGPDSNTAEGRVIGTAAYMSPEQAEGTAVDFRSDIFSLGIIFYEMATGERPFKGKTTISTLSSILKDTPPSVVDIKPRLPRHLGRIIRRCLAKDPDRRYQTVADLHNDLRDLKDEMSEESLHSGVGTVQGSGAVAGSRATGSEAAGAPPAAVPSAGGTPATATPRARPRMNALRYVIPVLAVGVAVILAVVFIPGRDKPSNAKVHRLAVLPFENLGDVDDEYFADGITEEITAKLAGISGLAVISRASATKYKNTDKEILQIGDELGVDFVLEGTIRWDKRGGTERVRITPQLVNVADNSNVWAETYEREIDEIFAVQADIARQIAEALDVTLAGGPGSNEEKHPTDNVEAYQAYLRSMDYDEENPANLQMTINLLERAVELDPAFAVAWARLSRTHSGMYHYGYDQTQPQLDAAKTAAERAMALDPDLPEAYLARAYYYYWGFRDYDRALEAIDVAERLSPNDPRLLEVKSFVLRRQGKFGECLDYMKRASELDPQNAVVLRDIGYTYSILRRPAEAMPYYERAIAVAPDFTTTYTVAAFACLAAGDGQRAVEFLQQVPDKRNPGYLRSMMIINFIMGNFDRVIELATVTPDRIIWDQDFVNADAFWAAEAYAQKGDEKTAREYYERALAVVEKELRAQPDDYRLHGAIAQLYAALGQKEDAIRHGRRAVELMPTSKDILIGGNRIHELAFVYTRVGETQLALDQIDRLFATPNGSITIPILETDPRFEPLRDEPRYKEIIAKYQTRLP